MAINNRTPIVTNGLVMYLDAGNRNSYISGSAMWRDVSLNNNNGTLVNGPTFSSDNGGSIVFDGIDDYALVPYSSNIPTGSSARSVSLWFYTNASTWNANINNLFFYGTSGISNAFGIDFDSYPQMEVYTWGGLGRDLLFNTTFSLVGWKNIMITYNGALTILIYENGVYTQTLSLSGPTNTSISDVYIGATNPSVLPGNYFTGSIAITQIYNRALSAIEVSQNYNAQKSRFNLI